MIPEQALIRGYSRPDVILPDALRQVNRIRCARWHPGYPADDWTLGDWGNAFAGEAGELCNVIKKLRRHEGGASTAYNTPELTELQEKAAEECADVLLYLDLLMWKAGVTPDVLLDALVDKFNRVSEAQDWPDLTVAVQDL